MECEKTLFIRNLPYNTTTNEELQEIFSHYGPLKACFVVTEKGKVSFLVIIAYFIIPNSYVLYLQEVQKVGALHMCLILQGITNRILCIIIYVRIYEIHVHKCDIYL